MGDAAKSLFPKITHPKKRAFLMSYIETSVISVSASLVGIDRKSHNHWLHTDPDYVEAFALAKSKAADHLEDEATRRALGWMETRYTPEGTEYHVPRHSDTLMIFRLKGEMSKYREAQPIIGYSPDVVNAVMRKVAELVGPEQSRALADALQNGRLSEPGGAVPRPGEPT